MAKTTKGKSPKATSGQTSSALLPAAPKTVPEIILAWSLDRPQWQRDALRRITLNGAAGDADVQELVQLCKRECGDPSVTTVPVPLDQTHLPANAITSASIALSSISKVAGVNLLAPDQVLSFAPTGLTIVYGDNGAGKSGYARILKRACKARQPGDIAGNAFDPITPPPTAQLDFNSNGSPQPPINWNNEPAPHPILSAVSVFDRESGTVHVREKNEVAFRPFGLDIPDELAATCQRVKDALTAEHSIAERSRDAVFLRPVWKPVTAVGKILSALTADTDLSSLLSLAELSEAEQSRFSQLNEDLAKDPLRAASEQLLLADELKALATQLEQVEQQCSDAVLQQLVAASDAARSKRQAVDVAATAAFGTAGVEGVGGSAWQALWTAAKRYAEAAAYPGMPFPVPGEQALCLLCHQPLADDARTRLQGFDAFVRADVERQARQAEEELAAARKRFDAQKLRTITFTTVRKRLRHLDKVIDDGVHSFLGRARLRRRVCERILAGETLPIPSPKTSPSAAVRGAEARVRLYAEQLRKAAQEDGRKVLEQERDELADRIALAHLAPKAQLEVQRLKLLALLAKAMPSTNTNAITKLGNDIADQIITPKIRDRFQDEIVGLAANRVRVEIVRSGGKFGSPQYQVRFFANAAARVHTVLSEGEQTCVALAVFLTELATSLHHSALVFDDPVTSLDHRWRKRVAQRLVAEAARRQVIVFTHDLVFVHDLKDHADGTSTPSKIVTVARGPAGAGIVSNGLPWRGTSIKDRVDKLEKEVRDAKRFHDTHDEDEYRNRVFKIYNGLRSTWERAIEDTAFNGVVVRHRDYVNTKNLRKATVLTEADCDAFDAGFKKCCDQTDAHDTSRARTDEPPSPDEILRDVQAVGSWVAAIRARQNRVS